MSCINSDPTVIVGYHAARLEIPEYCPPHFEELMLDCWEEDPTARPTFKEIVQRLDKIAASGVSGGGKGRSSQIGSRGGGPSSHLPRDEPRKQHKQNRKSWDAEARDVFKEAGLDEHKKQHHHDDQQREDKGKDKHQDLKERKEEEV